MPRKLIWLISFILSAAVWFGVREWKPYLFGEMLSGSMIRQLNFNDAVTWEPATLISVLLIGFAFLFFSNILHTLFYRRRLPRRVPKADTQQDRIAEQLHQRSHKLAQAHDSADFLHDRAIGGFPVTKADIRTFVKPGDGLAHPREERD